VTRVLVGDMADGGLVMVHRPTMTATAPTSPSGPECCTACGPSEPAASSRAGYRRRCQRGDGRAAGDPVERVRGLRVRISPLPRAQPRVRPDPGDHDAARGRHHDPHYLVWNGLGLTDTHVALWAHNLFSSAYISCCASSSSLPRELFEAARVDGADRPAPDHAGADRDLRLRVQGELDRPHAAADLPARRLAVHPALGLKVILDQFGQGGERQREVVLPASVIATVPLPVIVLLGQRYFVEGIATTGRKG
jgi:hypothetical protein